MQTRRDFGKLALAMPVASAIGATLASGTRIGATTASFREMVRKAGADNIDDVVKALRFGGVDEIELSSANVEPGPVGLLTARPPSAYPPDFREPTAAEIAASKQRVRSELLAWRMKPANENIVGVREKFKSAGISVFAYSVEYDEGFSDAEIDVTFLQARSLGVEVIAAAASVTMARRLVGFAEKHRMVVSFRNSGAISTGEQMKELLGLSKQFRLNFDIGNFTATNGDPVAFLNQNHESISHLRIKDRRAKNGPNERFGDGDTPIKLVMAVLKDKKLSMPALVDYEYLGIGTPQEEVKRCMNYLRAAV